ncbi:uncharacterized protein EV420DRAFT_1582210 [Desarmillaria tabescens]|uniref:Uncharacterized protein n=1 Tax=Armillaria tabescens TaxID=1929756 RepID=A0AA39MNA4_ARMTA|nr:uncharacterized protein EV420DRAFT_1582210 [Desarmillaria tabescens]KAK0440208.1 hypothetical protein EV420DRAFT_1582210 [Desarmillaria tabescens]
MEKGGSQTSDRPRSIARSETFSGGLRSIMLNDTPRWRILAFHSYLKTDKVAYAASVTITLTYGKTTPRTLDDPDLQDMVRDSKRFRMVILPGAYLVDTLPILRWLKRWHQDSLVLIRRCDAGEDVPACLGKDLLNNKMSFDQAAYLAGAMFGAGSNTVRFLALMLLAVTKVFRLRLH